MTASTNKVSKSQVSTNQASTNKAGSDQPSRGGVFNLPNQLTTLRLVLSIVLFVFLALDYFLVSAILFVVAASTDWLDGYLARKYGMVTVLGRILDPFVDKVIVCGTFIFLVAEPRSQIAAWMAVVIVGRELLVTALRSYFEGEGVDFSASLSGKLKMVVQCAAAVLSMTYLAFADRAASDPQWLYGLLVVTVWAAVGITVLSGLVYIRAAVALMRS